LTFCIIPADGKCSGLDKLEESIFPLELRSNSVFTTKEVKECDFKLEVGTVWKFFIYSNEYLSEELREVLPILCKIKEYDYYSFYKQQIMEDGVFAYTKSPRLFLSSIEMSDNRVFPKDIENLKGVDILDGFILG
jgi:hypothetical protein